MGLLREPIYQVTWPGFERLVKYDDPEVTVPAAVDVFLRGCASERAEA